MKKLIKESYQTLKKLLDQIIATNEKGFAVSLDDAIEKSIKMIIQKTEAGGKLMFIGNGGSAAIASHMAVDFWKNGGIKATAFNDAALLTCLSNDCGYPQVFERSVAMFGEKNDILIAISSSGKSENILRAVDAAKKKNVDVITFSGFEIDNPLRTKGAINFYVPISHYGHVEVIHHFLCHCLADIIIENKSKIIERIEISE